MSTKYKQKKIQKEKHTQTKHKDLTHSLRSELSCFICFVSSHICNAPCGLDYPFKKIGSRRGFSLAWAFSFSLHITRLAGGNGIELLVHLLGAIARPGHEHEERQQHDANHGDDEDVVLPEVLEEVQVLNLRPEQQVDLRLARVQRERGGTELHRRHRAHQYDPGVGQERVHLGLAHFHRINTPESETDAQLKVALDASPEQVECIDSEEQDSKQREASSSDIFRVNEEVVQERVDGPFGEDEEDDVEEPGEGEDGADTAEDEFEEIPERIGVTQVSARVQKLLVLLDKVERPFKSN